MAHAQRPGAGLRRFDSAAAKAAALSDEFRGLPGNISPSVALGAMKRAAAYIGIPPGVVQLLDTLFSWTKADDWKAGAHPVVWPRNETIARKLGIQVRQVQNLLNRAVVLGLISHRDSPNGHRGGKRRDDGQIAWGYGIVLAPIGARYAEFVAVADRGAAEDSAIDQIKRRMKAARRRISAVAQTVIDQDLVGISAEEELAVALMAIHQMKKVRDIGLLTACVSQLEGRAKAIETAAAALLEVHVDSKSFAVSNQNACSGDSDYIHSTATNQLQTAKAVTRSRLPEKSSGGEAGSSPSPLTGVELDLENHGIDPAFIEAVTPDLCTPLQFTNGSWGALISLAETLASQVSIHKHAWHEACRLMGERGAAASVIATVHKYRIGEVHRPGAYLRGMSERASKGELNLGRTYHGLKDRQSVVGMKPLQFDTSPSSIGEMARRVLAKGPRAFGHS